MNGCCDEDTNVLVFSYSSYVVVGNLCFEYNVHSFQINGRTYGVFSFFGMHDIILNNNNTHWKRHF